MNFVVNFVVNFVENFVVNFVEGSVAGLPDNSAEPDLVGFDNYFGHYFEEENSNFGIDFDFFEEVGQEEELQFFYTVLISVVLAELDYFVDTDCSESFGGTDYYSDCIDFAEVAVDFPGTDYCFDYCFDSKMDLELHYFFQPVSDFQLEEHYSGFHCSDFSSSDSRYFGTRCYFGIGYFEGTDCFGGTDC